MARALVSSDEDVLEASVPHASNTERSGADGEGALWQPDMRARTKEAFAAAPQFLMLDFRCAAIISAAQGIKSAVLCVKYAIHERPDGEGCVHQDWCHCAAVRVHKVWDGITTATFSIYCI